MNKNINGKRNSTKEVMRYLLSASMAVLLLGSIPSVNGQGSSGETGTITGVLVDAANGEGLLGVTIRLLGTQLGDITDIDGNYSIKNVPVGTYTLMASSIGYDSTIVANLVVESNQKVFIKLSLTERIIETGKTIKVQAKALKNTEAALLKKRQKADAVSDAISSQDISRAGSSDAGDAITKVTGVSVVDGKYVYVRGLGGRYANTNLNGSRLPSADPDRQTVSLDIIPTALLDNIIVSKSFTPEKQGDFAGGSVDIATRDFPEHRTLSVSVSGGFNSETTLGNGGLGHVGSNTDWLGFDHSHRVLPGVISDNGDLLKQVPENRSFINIASGDSTGLANVAQFMDKASRAFNPEMQPGLNRPPINQGYSFAYGDLLQFFERPLGVVASLSYNRKFSTKTNYRDGGFFKASENSKSLSEEWNLAGTRSTDEVLWGSLVTLNYSIHPGHKLAFSYVYNRDGESDSRFLAGSSLEFIDPGDTLRTRVLGYKERQLRSMQFSGDHTLGKEISLDWKAAFSNSSRNEPDLRFFTDEARNTQVEDPETGDLIDTTQFLIEASRYPAPQRLFRDINENSKELGFNLTIPVSTRSKIETGVSYLTKDRSNREEAFSYVLTDKYANFDGNINAYISDVGLDRIDTLIWRGDTTYQYIFSNYLSLQHEARNQYTGNLNVMGFYGRFDFPVTNDLKFVGGVRYETTDLNAVTEDPNLDKGRIKQTDILPSVNFIYSVTDQMNLRLSYGRTLARPMFWEIVPAAQQEFGTGRFRIGNPNLEMTTINNLDARWEWFLRPGEIFAVSGFYKRFTNPIEQAIFSVSNDIQPQNVDNATVLGAELEFRHRLDHLSSLLRNVKIGGNVTLVHSKTESPEAKLDSRIQATRPMAGQSPYIVNLDINFNSQKSGTSASIYYNVSGKRFAFNAESITPDIYEQPRQQVDFVLSQRLFGSGGPKLKFSVKNILNEDVKFLYDKIDKNNPNEVQRVFTQYSVGRSISVGLTRDIW